MESAKFIIGFTGTYLHYDNASETELEPKFEESVAQRVKKKREKSAKQEEKWLRILKPNA